MWARLLPSHLLLQSTVILWWTAPWADVSNTGAFLIVSGSQIQKLGQTQRHHLPFAKTFSDNIVLPEMQQAFTHPRDLE